MTIDSFVESKNLDFNIDDKRFFGNLIAQISGYMRYPALHVKQGSTKVRDWNSALLEELLPLVKIYKSRRLVKKIVIVRRKK